MVLQGNTNVVSGTNHLVNYRAKAGLPYPRDLVSQQHTSTSTVPWEVRTDPELSLFHSTVTQYIY